MLVSHMRTKDRIDRSSNWSPWNTKINFSLKDLELWDKVHAHIVVPPVTALVVPILIITIFI
jgi:hypothetical protein